MILRIASAVATVASGGIIYAASQTYCHYGPRSQWLSVTEVELKLKEAGMKLRAIRVTDDRCYAVLADLKNGQMVNLIINPVSADIMSEVTNP